MLVLFYYQGQVDGGSQAGAPNSSRAALKKQCLLNGGLGCLCKEPGSRMNELNDQSFPSRFTKPNGSLFVKASTAAPVVRKKNGRHQSFWFVDSAFSTQ